MKELKYKSMPEWIFAMGLKWTRAERKQKKLKAWGKKLVYQQAQLASRLDKKDKAILNALSPILDGLHKGVTITIKPGSDNHDALKNLYQSAD